MSDKLAEICDSKRAEVDEDKKATSFAELNRLARRGPPVRGFAAALKAKAEANGIALICEIKKASPSAGLIRDPFIPAEIAAAYEAGGAACLSVLTNAPYFHGSPDYLKEARNACSLPILRKDFMIDPWQIVESRAMGADCVLLIMAALDDALALEMHQAAVDYGMDVLIEVHDRAELERAIKLPSGLIGINNRDLKTLVTHIARTEELAPFVPKSREIVGESGLQTSEDLERLTRAGVRRFLIGESLMRQKDLVKATKKLSQLDGPSFLKALVHKGKRLFRLS